MKILWEPLKAEIKTRIPLHNFRMWIDPLVQKEGAGNTLVLSCPNNFSKKRVMNYFGPLIVSEIKKAYGQGCELVIEVSGQCQRSKLKTKPDLQLSLPNLNGHPHNGRLLRKDFTFDQFVVGGNNDFAYSAAFSLAAQENSQQKSLLLLSKPGLGKSHLSQAIGHHILLKRPSARVYYTTTEDFSNEMVQSFRNSSIPRFQEKYRNGCDVLLLEDVHFLTGKERTQVELNLILDTLFDSDKKIIFTSCYLPAEMTKLNERLRSRLSCSLISNIDPPNFKTRVRILKKKSLFNGYKIPEEVTSYLASELTEDVRQLEGGLIGVTAKSSLLGSPVDLSLAKSIVKNIVRYRQNITIDVIKKVICKFYKISNTDLVSRSRKLSIVRPRQIAIFLSRRYTDLSLQDIGKNFNRYHATALHSIDCIDRGLKEKGSIQKQVEFLCQKLESGKY